MEKPTGSEISPLFISEMFGRYVNWKILLHFTRNPTREYYVNELSDSLKIGRGTASQSLRHLADIGLLERIERANLRHYRLRDTLLSREIKRLYGIAVFCQIQAGERIMENEAVLSVALYGSYASGEWDHKSDVDLLLISDGSVDYTDVACEVSEFLDAEVNVEVISSGAWLNLRGSKDVFYENVIRNHVILAGGELP